MKKSTVVLIILNILVVFSLPLVCEVTTTKSPDFLRLHVRANSNSVEDQVLKLKVRDAVLETTTDLLKDCNSKEEAIFAVNENIKLLENKAKKTIFENGYSYPVEISVNKEVFPYREYDGFFLPPNIYDSLIVKIGEGKGHNWWCVVFPAVCMSGSSEVTEEKSSEQKSTPASLEVDLSSVPSEYHLSEKPVPDNVTYDLFIVRLFKNLFGIK